MGDIPVPFSFNVGDMSVYGWHVQGFMLTTGVIYAAVWHFDLRMPRLVADCCIGIDGTFTIEATSSDAHPADWSENTRPFQSETLAGLNPYTLEQRIHEAATAARQAVRCHHA